MGMLFLAQYLIYEMALKDKFIYTYCKYNKYVY